jgi:arylsulfatase A-like enzyme
MGGTVAVAQEEEGENDMVCWMTVHEALRRSLTSSSPFRVDLDRLVGSLLAVLEAEVGSSYLASTFVVFTSDNGYHLGEKRILYDKCQPYDFDIRCVNTSTSSE